MIDRPSRIYGYGVIKTLKLLSLPWYVIFSGGPKPKGKYLGKGKKPCSSREKYNKIEAEQKKRLNQAR